jgi:PST family polysaccharide transporter
MRALHDVGWTAAEAACGAGLAVVSGFALAHLIGPAALGLGAAMVAPNVLLWILANALYADAIVQRGRLGAGGIAAACRASFVVGCGCALAQVAVGPPFAAMLGAPQARAMALLLALPLPLVGLSAVAQGLLVRQRRYRSLAFRTIIGQGGATCLGLIVALRGGGAWAPVAQQSASAILGACVLLSHAPPPWRGRPDWRAAAEMLRLGAPLVASTVVQSSRYRVFAVLVGASAGAAVLGQVHLAFRIVDTLRELTNNALWRLLLPRFARLQKDRAALLAGIDRALGVYALVALPGFALLLVLMAPFLLAVLGPAWLPAAAAAAPLVGLAWLNLLSFAAGAAVIASGHTAGFLGFNLLSLGLTMLLWLLVRPGSPGSCALVWAEAQVIAMPVAFWLAWHRLGIGPWRQLRAGLPALLVALLAAAAGTMLPAWTDVDPAPAAQIAARLLGWAVVALPGMALLARTIPLRRPVRAT